VLSPGSAPLLGWGERGAIVLYRILIHLAAGDVYVALQVSRKLVGLSPLRTAVAERMTHAQLHREPDSSGMYLEALSMASATLAP
jgi:hypothetical protein